MTVGHVHTPVGKDACALAQQWGLDQRLAENIVRLEAMAVQRFRVPGTAIQWPGLFVISGFRTEAENAVVGGSTGSRHLRCPSLAIDLQMGSVEGVDSVEVWQILGGMWEFNGWGRWGGRFSAPPGSVNTREMNHFDTGAL